MEGRVEGRAKANACPGPSAGIGMSPTAGAHGSELDGPPKPRTPVASDLRQEPGADTEGAAKQKAARRDLRGGCVKKTRERHAVRKMKVDPSEPPCRGRLQTTGSCAGSMAGVVSVSEKASYRASGEDREGERK